MAAGETYYSEKNFSLGEICVLKLLRMLEDVRARTLILIDELEMALHPAAQVQLFKYLREVAQLRNLTIIFSTHSVTLIKTASRDEIIYMTREGERITGVRKPYISQVLGGLAHIEEKSADIVIYVEDDAAVACARPLLELVLAEKLSNASAISPTWHVVPIGSFLKVIEFLDRHRLLHRDSVESYAICDEDVRSETVEDWLATQNHDRLAWLQQFDGNVKYLPWTPEVGILRFFERDRTRFRADVRKLLNDNTIHLADAEYDLQLAGAALRRNAKSWLNEQVRFISEHHRKTPDEVLRAMGTSLAASAMAEERPRMMQNYGGIFR